MTPRDESNMNDYSADQVNAQWKKIYLIGGYSALISFCLILFDIVFGSTTSGNLTEISHSAIGIFSDLQNNWFTGLYRLDLLNMVNALIMIPVYFALFGAHRKNNLPYAALSLILVLIGTTIMVSANTALPMLELGRKYVSSTGETERVLYAAAGEALIARGRHGGFGTFIGFALSTIASICVSYVMLHGRVFTRRVSYLGLIGHSLLLVYVVLVTFLPGIESMAAIVAAPGGLMVLAWVIIVGRKLLKMGSELI